MSIVIYIYIVLVIIIATAFEHVIQTSHYTTIAHLKAFQFQDVSRDLNNINDHTLRFQALLRSVLVLLLVSSLMGSSVWRWSYPMPRWDCWREITYV